MTAGASGLRLGRARFRCLGTGLVVLGFLFVAALVIGLSARVAQACDPVTGQGCDSTPSTAAAPPSTAEPAPPQGGTQSPAAGSGQPFVPPTSAAAAAPTTTVAPTTPTTASAPSDQTSGSSGGFPWEWVLGGGAAATVTGAAATGVVVRNRTKPDPLGDFTRACDDLCFAKQQQAQAEADVQAAQTELNQIDQAYYQALDYLDNQLRTDYIFRRRLHATAGAILTVLPVVATLPLSFGAYAVGTAMGLFGGSSFFIGNTPDDWNAQLNAEMKSAHGEIDRIHDQNRAPWQAKLDDAQRRQNEALNGVAGNDLRLAELRAANPDVQFPACGCE
ncbi:MAG TPA: hypothetical protein VG869_08700 [Acidimicrobiia bacterium]|jgi:hypothetical protein|nr:hypothetical protein [Acidimicrobiia bacterium]